MSNRRAWRPRAEGRGSWCSAAGRCRPTAQPRDLALEVGETEPDDRYRCPKTAGRKPYCYLLTDAASPRRRWRGLFGLTAHSLPPAARCPEASRNRVLVTGSFRPHLDALRTGNCGSVPHRSPHRSERGLRVYQRTSACRLPAQEQDCSPLIMFLFNSLQHRMMRS
jgi:hypothetical protein